MYVCRLRAIYIFTLQKWDHSVIDCKHAFELPTKSFRWAFRLCSSGSTLFTSQLWIARETRLILKDLGQILHIHTQ